MAANMGAGNIVYKTTAKKNSSTSKNTGTTQTKNPYTAGGSMGAGVNTGGASGTKTNSNMGSGAANTSGNNTGSYTPGYTGTYFEKIFADPTNDYNARAYVPGSGWSSIVVKDGKTQTTNLPVGTIVETASGAYRVTGMNPDGSYQSVKYTGVLPDTVEDKSIYADMYDRGYNSATIGQMVQDAQNGSYGGQSTTTYIDGNGDKQTGYVQAGTSYLDSMLEELQNQYQAQLEANDSMAAATTRQAILQLENQKNSLNQEYDDLYNQLYINRRLNEKRLPEQLAAMGYTGGLTESSLLGLQNEYQQALREGEIARLQGISDLDTAIADAQLSGDIAQAQAAQDLAAQYYANYAQAIQALQSQANWQQEFQYQAALAAQQQQEAQRQAVAENGWVLLENGILPNAATLSAMQLSEADAQALLATLGGSYGGSYGTYGGTVTYPTVITEEPEAPITLGTVAQNILNSLGRGYSSQENMAALINNAYINNNISAAEADYLLRAVGV